MADDLRARYERMRAEGGPKQKAYAEAKLRELGPVDTKAGAPAGPRQADPDPAQPPTFGQKVAAAFDPRAMLKDAGAAGDRFNRSATLGIWPWLTDTLGIDSPERRQRSADEATKAPADMAYLDRAKEMAADTAGASAGSVAGPGAAIGRGSAQIVQGATPTLARTGVGRTAQTTATGMLAGGGSGAVQAAAEGATPGETLDAAQDAAAVGGIFGGALQLLGELGGAFGRAVDRSRGAQARRTVEAQGGEVGVTTPGRGIPEIEGVEPNDRGVGAVSRQSAANVLQRMEDEHFANTVTPHVAAKQAIAASPAGQNFVEATPVVHELHALLGSQRLLPGEAAVVHGLIQQMQPGWQPGQRVFLSQTALNDVRQKLMRASNVAGAAQGGQQSVPQDMLEDAAFATKSIVDEGPYRDTNARYSGGTEGYEANRRMLDLPPKPRGRPAPEGPSEQEIAKVGNMMSRQEQNSVTAGVRNSDRLQQFAEQNPQHARDMAMPRTLEAVGDLTFRSGATPERGGLINRLPPGIGLGASGALMFAGDPKFALGPLLAELIGRNTAPISGRLLYGPGMAAMQAPQGAQAATPRLVPALTVGDPLDAAIETGRRKRKQKQQGKKD